MSSTPETLDVLSMGETMALLVAQEPGQLAEVQSFSKRIAGADTNVAIGLARLGFKVGWVSRLGADSFGHYVRKTVEAEGVDTSQVEIDPQRSIHPVALVNDGHGVVALKDDFAHPQLQSEAVAVRFRPE